MSVQPDGGKGGGELPSSLPPPTLEQVAAQASRLLGTSASQVWLRTDVHGAAGRTRRLVGGGPSPEDAVCAVTAASRGPLVVADARTDVRVRELAPVRQGHVGACLGVPLTSDAGRALGALCVFEPAPRSWSEADVAALTRLAASAVAELDLSARRARCESQRIAAELAVEAAQVGAFDWDLATGAMTLDDRLSALVGHDRTSTHEIDRLKQRVHPDDLPGVSRALHRAIESCGGCDLQFRAVHPDGRVRSVAGRAKALGDRSGRVVRVVGAAYDATAPQQADARLARVLESMTNAFFLLDRQWRFAYVNGHAERLLGRGRDELLGGSIWKLFPHALGSDFETNYRTAMRTGRPTTFEAYYPAPLDAWYEVQAWPDPEGLSVYFLDISARRAVREQTEQAARRAHLLAEVTSELTGTLEAEEAVARLAQLVVPTLADWCLVTLVDADQDLRLRSGWRDVGWAHRDSAARPLVERYARLRWPSLTENAYVLRAQRTGEIVEVRSGATEAIQAVLVPGEASELIAELAPEAFMVLPLRGRGRTVGLLTLFNGASRGPIAGVDEDTARDVAGRAGLALDSGRLYRAQRDLAEALQRSLLTAPPAIDQAQVVVRYTPAAEAAQVGGDWYDAFLQPDGATALVIGDVIGHDSASAAAMGQVRTMLRTVAAHAALGPADVLRGVDSVMDTLQAEVTATAVVARLERTPEQRLLGLTRVRWSNAGHPPPMVINPDGTVALLDRTGADLLLGIDPRSERGESMVTLERGATLLLFTDGLVERRGQSIDDGLAQLRGTLADLAAENLSLDALCDEVLARMLPRRREDDVALVAVRLHPR